MEDEINPTVEQAFCFIRVCQMLSNLYRNIVVFRYDSGTGEVFILTADDIQILLKRDTRFLGLANTVILQLTQ